MTVCGKPDDQSHCVFQFVQGSFEGRFTEGSGRDQ